MDVPRNNEELCREFDHEISAHVKSVIKHSISIEDAHQAVWVALLRARVIDKFLEKRARCPRIKFSAYLAVAAKNAARNVIRTYVRRESREFPADVVRFEEPETW